MTTHYFTLPFNEDVLAQTIATARLAFTVGYTPTEEFELPSPSAEDSHVAAALMLMPSGRGDEAEFIEAIEQKSAALVEDAALADSWREYLRSHSLQTNPALGVGADFEAGYVAALRDVARNQIVPSDLTVDAAIRAFHEATFGTPDDGFLTPERLKRMRDPWRAALRGAAVAAQGGVPRPAEHGEGS